MDFESLPEDQREALSPLFDPLNPLAPGPRLPPKLSGALFDLLLKSPDMIPLVSDEDHLVAYLLSEKGYRPSVTDSQIRLFFWMEVENSITENRKMAVNNIHSLVCSEVTFRSLFTRQAHRAAYLLCKPIAYEVAIQETLQHGQKWRRRILDYPEIDGKGQLNMKLLELKFKISMAAEYRLLGAPKQNIQQLNVNVDAGKGKASSEIRDMIQKGDMNTIRKRLHEIEQEERAIAGQGDGPAKPGASDPIEAEVISVNKA